MVWFYKCKNINEILQINKLKQTNSWKNSDA